MSKCYWLEDEVDRWPNVTVAAEEAGIAIKVFEHPDEMKDRISERLEGGKKGALCFLIDLIVGGTSDYTDWDGNRRSLHGPNGTGASEVGFNVISQLLCHNDSPVKEYPIAVLTQRVDDGSVKEKIDEIRNRTGRESPIELFSKSDSGSPKALLHWFQNMRGSC